MADVSIDLGQTLSVDVSATDPDGDALVLTMVSNPTGATLAAGTIAWTPVAGDVGTAWFVVAVTDDGEPPLVSHAGFAVTVVDPAAGQVNHPPALAPLADLIVDAGDAITVTVTASDPDGDGLTLALVDQPPGMTLSGSTITWTTSSADLGSHWVSVSVTDDGAPPMSAYTGFAIEVLDPAAHVNHPPAITPIAPQAIAPGDGISVTVAASDPDGDNLTLALVQGPTGAALAGTTLTWTSTAGDVGAHWFVVSATDDGAPNLVAYAGFMVDVLAPPPPDNLPPIFFSVPAPGVAAACDDFLAAFEAVDPDGDTISYLSPNLPAGATLTMNGTVAELTWHPGADQVGIHAIAVYAVDDGQPAMSDSVVYTVSVTAPPAPTLTVPEVQVFGGQTAQVTATIDPPACYDLTAEGPTGSTFDAGTGTLSWATVPADFGFHGVTFTATDPGNAARTFTAANRVVVGFRDDFTTFAGYTIREVNLGWCCNGPASYAAINDGGAAVMHSHSDNGIDVKSRALQVFDRTETPILAIDYEFTARDVVVGPACGSGGLLQVFEFAATDPATVWPDWDTEPTAVLQLAVPDSTYGTVTGQLLFTAGALELTMALLHADNSNICTIDVYWDHVQLMPTDPVTP